MMTDYEILLEGAQKLAEVFDYIREHDLILMNTPNPCVISKAGLEYVAKVYQEDSRIEIINMKEGI